MMRSGSIPVLVAVFATVLLSLTAGYTVIRAYTVPTSARPVIPEVRQFSVRLLPVETGGEAAYHWMPSVIVVNAGDTVILRVTNGDTSSPHGFVLGGFNIPATPLAPGQTATFRFKATRPGIYHFGCGLDGCAPDHADQIGQIVVLGDQP